jgi:hypothetical protein
MTRKQEIALEIDRLKNQLRQRERENRIIHRSLLVMDTLLTGANLQVSSEVQKRS